MTTKNTTKKTIKKTTVNMEFVEWLEAVIVACGIHHLPIFGTVTVT